MIHANELRIGNIYNRKHGKGWTQTVIDEYIMGKIFTDDDPEYALDDFEPIPLSEHVLKTCGFENMGSWYGIKHIAKIWDEDVELVFEWSDKLLTVFANDQRILIMTECSLHSLQNLFFALTKTELNYKP